MSSISSETQRTSSGYFEQNDIAVNPQVDHILGLDNSNLHPHVHKFTNGMSGAATIYIAELGQVVKWNKDIEKIYGEANGYKLLKESPLAPYLLPLDTTHLKDGVISTPFYEGVQLREAVKKGSIEPIAAMKALTTLLTAKKEWWGSQNKEISNDQLVSMQREEWTDTIGVIENLIPAVAEHYKIPPNKLLFDPLVIDGKEIPSLATTLESVNLFLANRPSETILAHNDATGANLLVKPELDEIKLIDYQWTGKPSDPAEAFVRMGKWVSTSTLSQAPDYEILSVNGAIHLDSRNSPINPLAQQMQDLAESSIEEFSRALNQPDFNPRVNSYMAGSYLRELALSNKRGGPESSLFTIIKAGESIVKT